MSYFLTIKFLFVPWCLWYKCWFSHYSFVFSSFTPLHSFIRSFISAFFRSVLPSFIQSISQPVSRSFSYSFIHSFVPSFILHYVIYINTLYIHYYSTSIYVICTSFSNIWHLLLRLNSDIGPFYQYVTTARWTNLWHLSVTSKCDIHQLKLLCDTRHLDQYVTNRAYLINTWHQLRPMCHTKACVQYGPTMFVTRAGFIVMWHLPHTWQYLTPDCFAVMWHSSASPTRNICVLVLAIMPHLLIWSTDDICRLRWFDSSVRLANLRNQL